MPEAAKWTAIGYRQGCLHLARPARFSSSRKPTRLLLSYTPGGFEKWFLDIGTPVAKTDEKPPEIGPEDIKRAVAAAERYGVKFGKK